MRGSFEHRFPLQQCCVHRPHPTHTSRKFGSLLQTTSSGERHGSPVLQQGWPTPPHTGTQELPDFMNPDWQIQIARSVHACGRAVWGFGTTLTRAAAVARIGIANAAIIANVLVAGARSAGIPRTVAANLASLRVVVPRSIAPTGLDASPLQRRSPGLQVPVQPAFRHRYGQVISLFHRPSLPHERTVRPSHSRAPGRHSPQHVPWPVQTKSQRWLTCQIPTALHVSAFPLLQRRAPGLQLPVQVPLLQTN